MKSSSSHLYNFLQRRSTMIAGAVLAALTTADIIHYPSSTEAHAKESAPKFIISEKLDQMITNGLINEEGHRKLDLLILKNSVVAEQEAIMEVINDKRARLENAMIELEILVEQIAEAEHLPTAERDDALTSAVLMYNESLGGTEFSFNDGFANNPHAHVAPTMP